VTVVFSFIILGERTRWIECLTLTPVVLGLALCSFTEVSFNAVGFAAAMSTNCVDCMQNVYSKKIMKYYTPTQLQFYATCAALTIQIPFWFYQNGLGGLGLPPLFTVGYLFVDGLFFYMQSITAYGVVALVSPVTMSVVSTNINITTKSTPNCVCLSVDLTHDPHVVVFPFARTVRPFYTTPSVLRRRIAASERC
jgi:solute carrier family 35 protein E2